MHGGRLHSRGLRGVLFAVALLVLAVHGEPVRGDDSGLLGRLFRLGGPTNPATSTPGNRSSNAARTNSLPYGPSGPTGGSFLPPANNPPHSPAPTPVVGPMGDGPSTPELSESSAPGQRLTPRPRTTHAVTTADPLLTRMALGRSNDGSQFGMFLQVFADGTVIDSEGVHRLSPAELRPLAEIVQSGELFRTKGHCGAPSTDYIEHVHLVVFDRRLGRLLAHSFSYSGNPQGCDQSVRQLHNLLEALQAKLSRQPVAASGTTAPPADAPPTAVPGQPEGVTNFEAPPLSRVPASDAPASGNAPAVRQSTPPLPDPGRPAAASTGNVIPLTPIDPR